MEIRGDTTRVEASDSNLETRRESSSRTLTELKSTLHGRILLAFLSVTLVIGFALPVLGHNNVWDKWHNGPNCGWVGRNKLWSVQPVGTRR